MGHEFLSADWIDSVRAVRDEYAGQLPEVPIPELRINLEVTEAPETVADDGVIHAHADSGPQGLTLEVGALPDPDLTVTLDYHTAYELLVTQKPNAALGAFLTGRIRFVGDLDRLSRTTGFDPAALPQMLASLGITGSSTLADIDPVAAEIGNRIRELTA
jgi:hypothetical protein